MQSTKIGAVFCGAQNFHKNNTSFKAKFSNETIKKMGEDTSSNYLELYKDIFQANEKISGLGSKDTLIKIENPEDLTTSNTYEDHSGDTDAFFGWSDGHPAGPNYEPSYITETYPASKATLVFTHHLFKNAEGSALESIVDFQQEKSLNGNKFLEIAKDINASIVEQGEEGLAISYVKDLINNQGNKGSLVEASRDFIGKLEQSDFSKKAIELIQKAVKSIDLKNALDSRITKLLKL